MTFEVFGTAHLGQARCICASNPQGCLLHQRVEQVEVEVCGCEWDDRDDTAIPLGGGYSCQLAWEHAGPHRSGTFLWEK